jgi:5-methylcytosine-specific restriction endonuclease McrA
MCVRKSEWESPDQIKRLYASASFLHDNRVVFNIKGNEPIWMNEPLTLHIDHIDGEKTNNHISNLQFLCPNCHQQTPTWGNKSKKK